jgi:hypothetical protein
MDPLDDHELMQWAMRAGLTRDEVARPCAPAGGAADRLTSVRLIQLFKPPVKYLQARMLYEGK